MHSSRAVAGIVEIMDERERKCVPIRQPLHAPSGAFGQDLDDLRIGFAFGLPLNIACESGRGIDKPPFALEAGFRRWDQPGRECGRAAGRAITLDHNDIGPFFARRQSRAKPGRARADDQHGRNGFEEDPLSGLYSAHEAPSVSMAAPTVATAATDASAATAVS